MLCSVLGPLYRKDIKALEHVPRRKWICEGSGAQCYGEQLRELGWFYLEKRRLRETTSLSAIP